MKQTLLLLTLLLSLCLPHTQAHARQTTLKEQMMWIHERFEINFIYDSAIDLNVAYNGTPMSKVATSVSSEADETQLRKCLDTLFRDTGISWEINRKYVVLTKGRKKPKEYTIMVEEQHDTIAESRITALLDRKRNATQTGLKKLDGRHFKGSAAPLAQPDLIKSLQQLTGVAAGTEMLSGLHVHGGTGHDNLFLLDGVPLYQVSHLAGLFSSFNTEMVDQVDFYKSGFPSRYGGKLSSVVDVTTREGNMQEYHGMFSVGLLNGTVQFEGPIVPGKTSFNVGMRRSWLDVLSVPTLAILNRRVFEPRQHVDGRYALTDLNASVTHLFSKDNQLSLNIYVGRDFLDVGIDKPTVEYWEGERFLGSNGFGFGMSWGNVLASLNWKYRISDELHTDVIGYFTRSSTGLAYEEHQWEFDSRTVSERTADECSESVLNDIGAKADFDWIPSGNHHVRFGADAKIHLFEPSRRLSYIHTTEGSSNVLAEDAARNPQSGADIALYAEDEMSFGSWFKANMGLRYSMLGTKDRTWHALEPRVALRFQCGPMAALKLSYTEMNQSVHQVCPAYIDLPMYMWMPSSAEAAPLHSRQLAADLSFDLPHGLFLNVAGYYKTMDNIMEYMGMNMFSAPIDNWEEAFTMGKGKSYGMETELSWRAEDTELSASYTLSWNKRLFEEFWHDWYLDRNDNRHKFTLTASHKFSNRFEAYASWNYHTGNRMTIESHGFHYKDDSLEMFYDSPNNYKFPDYHRLDLGVNFRKTTKRGNESIWTISVYNAYNRRNPIYAEMGREYIKGEDGNYHATGKYELTHVSLIPLLPMFSYTLRF